ncbi:MAG: aminotransferase class IV [Luteolibacter sp.]
MWIDGIFSPADAPTLPIHDQSYLSGMGVFETIRAASGVPLFLDAHFTRLTKSASCFDLELPDFERVRDGIVGLLEKQRFEHARIRLTLSGEIASGGVPFRFGGKSRTTLIAFPLEMAAARPVRLVTAPFRIDSASPLAGHKCTSYALHALAMRHARAAGGDEALMLDHEGNLAGGASANVFWVKNGVVQTPDARCGCRDGVTRERVLRACGQLDLRCRTTEAEPDVLDEADEIFITSAIRGVRSVIELDGRPCKQGALAERIRLALDLESESEMSRR